MVVWHQVRNIVRYAPGKKTLFEGGSGNKKVEKSEPCEPLVAREKKQGEEEEMVMQAPAEKAFSAGVSR